MKAQLRIAVADDEPDMRDYFRKVLPRMGHTVVAVAENGRELVEQCRDTHPDLVITDIRMPEMDGIDAAREICKDHPTPIVFVSAYHDPDLKKRAEMEQVLCYLVKPVRQTELIPVLAKASSQADCSGAIA